MTRTRRRRLPAAERSFTTKLPRQHVARYSTRSSRPCDAYHDTGRRSATPTAVRPIPTPSQRCSTGSLTWPVRHTFATLRLEAGTNLEIISDRLGHANPTVASQICGHRSTGSIARRHGRSRRSSGRRALLRTAVEDPRRLRSWLQVDEEPARASQEASNLSRFAAFWLVAGAELNPIAFGVRKPITPGMARQTVLTENHTVRSGPPCPAYSPGDDRSDDGPDGGQDPASSRRARDRRPRPAPHRYERVVDRGVARPARPPVDRRAPRRGRVGHVDRARAIDVPHVACHHDPFPHNVLWRAMVAAGASQARRVRLLSGPDPVRFLRRPHPPHARPARPLPARPCGSHLRGRPGGRQRLGLRRVTACRRRRLAPAQPFCDR